MLLCFRNTVVLLVFFVLGLSQADALAEQLEDQDSDNQEADFWQNALGPPPAAKPEPICDREVNVFNLVINPPQFKEHFFIQGDPKVPDLSNVTTVIPRGCADYTKTETCCTNTYIRRIAEDAAARAKEMELVRDQYHYFAADVVEPALQVAVKDSDAHKVLSRLKNDKVHQKVIDYIDQCEDKLRLHFASTACKLCDKNLKANLREQKYLALGNSSCDELFGACSGAVEILRKAGEAYQADRDELAAVWVKGQQDVPIARALTWLDRASRLLRVRADELERCPNADNICNHYTPMDKTSFCNKVAKQGYVYRPYEWGNVLMLHVSTLATDHERSHFVPGEVQQYLTLPEQALSDRVDRAMQDVQGLAIKLAADEEEAARRGAIHRRQDVLMQTSDAAATTEADASSADHPEGENLMELQLHEVGSDFNLVSPAEVEEWDKLAEGVNGAAARAMEHNQFKKLAFVSSKRQDKIKRLMKARKKAEALHNRQHFRMQNLTDCEHGEIKGYHCVCDECWAGVNCNEKMPAGPYFNQEFEPLEEQVSSGALQTLAVAGCQLADDLSHQLARIMLKPVKEGMEKIDSCAEPRGLNGESTFASMPLHVPMLATKRRYEYRIDVPIGQEKKYQVCHCFGPGCFEGDVPWTSLGTVDIFRTDDLVKEKVSEMRSPHYRRLIDQEEYMLKECSFDEFLLGEDASIKYTFAEDMLHFACEEGFERLAGVQQLVCVDGTWKVRASSTDWTMQEKANLAASPRELTDWNNQLPRCHWKLHDFCSDPTEHLNGAVSFKGTDAHEEIVTMNNTEDGLFWYMCAEAFESHERLLVGGDASIFKEGDLVLVKHERVGEILGRTETGDFEVSLQAADVNHSPEENVTVNLESLEKIERDGVYKRKCAGNGTWSPSNIKVRCAPIKAHVNNFVARVAHSSRFGEPPGDVSKIPEDDTNPKSLHAAVAEEDKKPKTVEMEYSKDEEDKDDKEDKEGSPTPETPPETPETPGSFLELGSESNVSSGKGKGYLFDLPKINPLDPPLIMGEWPVVFQKESALQINSCYTSHIDCVTGKVATDTVAAQMREMPEKVEVPVPEEPVKEEASAAWTYNLILAAVMALGVLLAILLLGWSGTQRPQPAATK